jgi:transposase
MLIGRESEETGWEPVVIRRSVYPEPAATPFAGGRRAIRPYATAVRPLVWGRYEVWKRRQYGWRIERWFAKLKEFRRVATRYEKLKQTFLGMIHLALGFIRLRAKVNVNTA